MYEPKLMGPLGAARAQGPSGREGRPRHRIGILSFSSPGHYYPLTALGRRLQSRGHEVAYFQVADLEPAIRAAGLRFPRSAATTSPPARSAHGTRSSGGLPAARRCGARCAGSSGRR